MFRTILVNTLTGHALIFIRTIVGIIAVPIYIKYLGVDVYGLMILVISTVGIASILDFGFEEGIVKFLTEYRVKNDKPLFNIYFNTFNLLYLFMAALILIFGTILYFAFPYIFHLNPSLQSLAGILIVIITFENGLNFLFNSFKGVLLSRYRNDLVNGANGFYTIVSNLLGICLVVAGYGVVAVVLARLFTSILREAYYIVTAFKIEKLLEIHHKYIDFSRVGSIFSFSFYIFMGYTSGLLVKGFDVPIIGMFLPVSYITAYDIVVKIVDSLMDIGYQINNSLFAVFSELKDRGDIQAIKDIYFITTKIIFSFTVLIGIYVITYIDQLMTFFSSAQLSITPELYMLVLLVVIEKIIFISHNPSLYIALAMGKHQLCGISSLVTSSINLVTKPLLVKYVGIAGVFLNNIIPSIIVQLIFINISAALKILNVTVKEYLTITVVRGFIPSVVVFVTYTLLNTFFAPQAILWILFHGVVGGFIYVPVAYYLLLTQKERLLFWEKIVNLRSTL